MATVTIAATEDIARDVVYGLSRSLESGFEAEVKQQRIGLRSAEPPSWLTLVADADWWVKGFGIYAALYVAEIVKEAGKTTWKNLESKVTRLKANRVDSLSEELVSIKTSVSARTQVKVGLPFPDTYFATTLVLNSSDSSGLAKELSLFVHFLPQLDDLVKQEELTEYNVATGLFLKLTSKGHMEVSWFDSSTFEKEVRELLL